MRAEEKLDLREGDFYWVRPIVDVEPSAMPPIEAGVEEIVSHWSNGDQPARFEGHDADGKQIWRMLGREETISTVEWIGEEISHPSNAGPIANSP